MRRPTPVPPELIRRPFHRAEAAELGVSPRMLEHRRFVELLPQVYVHPEDDFGPRSLTSVQWVQAARLALPDDAVLSHPPRFGRQWDRLFLAPRRHRPGR